MSFDPSTPQYTGTVTTNEYGMPTAAPQPKVLAASAGAGGGVALATILIWIIESVAVIDIPGPVEGAIMTVLSLGAAFVAGYFKKPSISAS